MADIKLSGQGDLARLKAKKETWTPPGELAEFQELCRRVIATSRYRNMYEELDPRDLQGIIRIKAHRCLYGDELDLEELVDLGSYAALLYLRMNRKDERLMAIRKGTSTVEVGAPGQLDQVNKPKPEPPPVKTANDNCLAGLKCPKCGSLGPLSIVSLCVAVVYDDGVDETTEFEWEDKSPCRCMACGKEGRVRDFDVKKGKRRSKK